MPQLHMSAETNTVTLQQNIRAVGVENIADIASYEIIQENGRVTHTVEFTGQGGFTASWDEGTGSEFSMNTHKSTVSYRDDEDDPSYVTVVVGKLKGQKHEER